ncbi:MAG: J domain-containing protein [Bacteroidota bacterium]
MDFKDYYKILGISKTASADDIKKAYRKLAVKYHPDKNPGDKPAEEKFKEVNEANEILADVDKRKKYDELGEDWKHYQASGGKERFDRFKQAGGTGGKQGNYSQGEHFTGDNFADFFEDIFGGGRSTKRSFKGQDYNAAVNISLEDAYTGCTRQLSVDTQKLEIKIKPGIADGQVLRLKGKAGKGMNGGTDGDIFLTVHIKEHILYKRKGNDLYSVVAVDLYTAVLGGKTIINTLRGQVNMNIKMETENGKMLRLKGMGMPLYDRNDVYGDLYAKVNIVLPKNISPKETELFRELSTINNAIHADPIQTS